MLGNITSYLRCKGTLCHNEICRNCAGVGPKTAIPMETLFPKASRKARDLLGRMLTVDAAERITVTSALNHPFLSKYHDPDDEPICIPVFDFEFEKQASAQFSKKLERHFR